MTIDLYTVSQIIILDNNGDRIFFRHYTPPHATNAAQAAPPAAAQAKFEQSLTEKTRKLNGDILLIDGKVVVYRTTVDVTFYVVGATSTVSGGGDENELMLYNVLQTLKESIEVVLNQTLDKRTLLENYDTLAIAVDEIVDGGIILESDALSVATRVSQRPNPGDLPIALDFSERGLLNAYQLAKQKFADRILQG